MKGEEKKGGEKIEEGNSAVWCVANESYLDQCNSVNIA